MKKEYHFWVYIVTNWQRKVLYTGMTNNLIRRLMEHYENRGKPETFAGRHCCYHLVYYEWHQYVLNAITREKEIKNMLRRDKEVLINETNPKWAFLNKEACGHWPPKNLE